MYCSGGCSCAVCRRYKRVLSAVPCPCNSVTVRVEEGEDTTVISDNVRTVVVVNGMTVVSEHVMSVVSGKAGSMCSSTAGSSLQET